MARVSVAKRALVAGAAMATMLGVTAGVASAQQPLSAQQNNPDYWSNLGYGQCSKTENPGTPFVLGNPPAGTTWSLLVIKAGSAQSVDTPNDVILNPSPGTYYHSSGKTISHVIVCTQPGSSGPPS
jgi:hypothetical protein